MRISGRLKLEEFPDERADKRTGVRICVPSGSVDKPIKVRSATELKEVHIDTRVVTSERGEVELPKNAKKKKIAKVLGMRGSNACAWRGSFLLASGGEMQSW